MGGFTTRDVHEVFPRELAERYEPKAVLGEGGFGVVLLVRDRALDRDLAVKVHHGTLRPGVARRFQEEAAILARLTHPSIVRVFDFGVAGKAPYLVLEYLEGKTLREAPPEDPVAAMLEVAGALEVVHREGVVHRDLNPSNILRTRDGRVVLIDFGLVHTPGRTRLTATGAILGTFPYVSPEQLRGERPGPESDWYAWGVTLFEFLEGRHPFGVPALLEVANGRRFPPLEFRRLAVDGREARTLAHLLSEDPLERPRSARDLQRRLLGTGFTRSMALLVGGSPGARRRQAIHAALAVLLLTGFGWWIARMRSTQAMAAHIAALRDERRAATRGELRQAMERLAADHRRPDGTLGYGGRGSLVDDHLREVVEECRDVRFTSRMKRFLDQVLDWIRLPPDEETEATLEEEIVPVLEHFSADQALLRTKLFNDGVFGAPLEGDPNPPGYEREVLEARHEELVELARRAAAELAGDRTRVQVLLVRALLTGWLDQDARARGFRTLRARLDAAEDPRTRMDLAWAAHALLNGELISGDATRCGWQEEVLDLGRPYLDPAQEGGDRLRRLRLVGTWFRGAFNFAVLCRNGPTARELADLARALDLMEAGLHVEPGAVALLLEHTLATYRLGGFMLAKSRESLQGILERSEELLGRVRKGFGEPPGRHRPWQDPARILLDTGNLLGG